MKRPARRCCECGSFNHFPLPVPARCQMCGGPLMSIGRTRWFVWAATWVTFWRVLGIRVARDEGRAPARRGGMHGS